MKKPINVTAFVLGLSAIVTISLIITGIAALVAYIANMI